MASSTMAKKAAPKRKAKVATGGREYCWAPGFRIKLDATVAIPKMERLAEQHGGIGTEAAMKAALADPVLSKHFTPNQREAAERWWRNEAAYLFRAACYKEEDGEMRHCFFSVALPEDDDPEAAPARYWTETMVTRDEDAKAYVVSEAVRLLRWIRDRRDDIVGVFGQTLFKEVDAAIAKAPKKK